MTLTRERIQLNLPNHPDVQKLLDIVKQQSEFIDDYHELLNAYKEQQESIIGGICFDKNFTDLLFATFPKENGVEVISSPDSVVRHITQHAIDELYFTIQLRNELAISGAMRWPWSQEAQIQTKHKILVYI